MSEISYFICPMSKNIVDSVIELDSKKIGLLPSRRQIEFNGGYVNNWTTETFKNYVKERSEITIERDHGGIGQGDMDEYESYFSDAKHFDIIHIDPWKKYQSIESGIKETIENIKFIHKLNPGVSFEVGTEEAIRKFTREELDFFLRELQIGLTGDEFEKIEYVCIQSGVGLDIANKKNVGKFNIEDLESMIGICKSYGKKSKEHNGDYLDWPDIVVRFKSGLDSLNIGPEIAQIETETIIDFMEKDQIYMFYEVCYDSKKWEKWVDLNFDFSNKRKLIMVCGHYNYQKLNDIIKMDYSMNETIKNNIKQRLIKLLNYVDLRF
jgi:hypothetical protein